jgi:hypothetical protein
MLDLLLITFVRRGDAPHARPILLYRRLRVLDPVRVELAVATYEAERPGGTRGHCGRGTVEIRSDTGSVSARTVMAIPGGPACEAAC